MMANKKNSDGGSIRLKWVRSAICTPVTHKKVVRGLGFTRLNQVIERPEKNRFELPVDGDVAVAYYRLEDGRVVLTHT